MFRLFHGLRFYSFDFRFRLSKIMEFGEAFFHGVLIQLGLPTFLYIFNLSSFRYDYLEAVKNFFRLQELLIKKNIRFVSQILFTTEKLRAKLHVQFIQ